MKKVYKVLTVMVCILTSICTIVVDVKANNKASFNIYFFNVGKADAALVECDGKYMMIDCGSDTMDSIYETNLKIQLLFNIYSAFDIIMIKTNLKKFYLNFKKNLLR